MSHWFGSVLEHPATQWLSVDMVKAEGSSTPKVSQPSASTPKVSQPSVKTPKAQGETSAATGGGGGGASALLGKEMPGHTWVSREAKGTHPDGGIKYQYRYSMQQGLGRQAKAGQEINTGYAKDRQSGAGSDEKNIARVKGTSAHGVTFEHQGKEQTVSHEDWHKFMTSHFGDNYTKAVDSSIKKWGNAVYKHVPKETFDMLWDKPEGKTMSAQQITQHLSDATYKIGKTTVGKKLQSTFKRIGVEDEAAVHHMVAHVLSRRNWDGEARAGMIGAGAFAGGFEAARVARNYKAMALSAERSAGAGKRVTASHVFAAVKKETYRNIGQWHEHKLKSQHDRLAKFNEHRVSRGEAPVQLQKKNPDDPNEPDGMLEMEKHARGKKIWDSRKAGDSVNKAAFAKMPKPHEDPEGFQKWLQEQDNVFQSGKREPDADATKRGGTEGFKRQFLDYVVGAKQPSVKKPKAAGAAKAEAVDPVVAHSAAQGHTPEQAAAHAKNVQSTQAFHAAAAAEKAAKAKTTKTGTATSAASPAAPDPHGGRPAAVDPIHGTLAKIPAADKKQILDYITGGGAGPAQVERIKAITAAHPWLHPSAVYELLRQHQAGGGVQGTPPATPGAGATTGAPTSAPTPPPTQQAPIGPGPTRPSAQTPAAPVGGVDSQGRPIPPPPPGRAPGQAPATTSTPAPEQSAAAPVQEATQQEPRQAPRFGTFGGSAQAAPVQSPAPPEPAAPEQSAAAPVQAPATTSTPAPEQSAAVPPQAPSKGPHPLATIADWQQSEDTPGTSDTVTATLEHHALPVRALIHALDRESLKDPAISEQYDAIAEMTPEQRAQQKVHIQVDSKGNPRVTAGHAALGFANTWNQQSIPARVEYLNGGESVEHRANPAVATTAPQGSFHPDRMYRMLREHIVDGHVPPRPSVAAAPVAPAPVIENTSAPVQAPATMATTAPEQSAAAPVQEAAPQEAPTIPQPPAEPAPEQSALGPSAGAEDAENPAELSDPMTATEELLTGAGQHADAGEHAAAADQLIHAVADLATGHATAEQLEQADAVAERIDTEALPPEQAAQVEAAQEHLDELRQQHSAETPEEVAQHLTEQVVQAAIQGDDKTIHDIEHLVHTAEPGTPEAEASEQVLAAVEHAKDHTKTRAQRGAKKDIQRAVAPFEDPEFDKVAQVNGADKGLHKDSGHRFAEKLLAYAKENPTLPGKAALWAGKVAGLAGKDVTPGAREAIARFVYDYLKNRPAQAEPELNPAASVAEQSIEPSAPTEPTDTSAPEQSAAVPTQGPEVIVRPRRAQPTGVPADSTEASAAVEDKPPVVPVEAGSLEGTKPSADLKPSKGGRPDVLEQIAARRAAGTTIGDDRKARRVQDHTESLAHSQQMLRRLHRERVGATDEGRKLIDNKARELMVSAGLTRTPNQDDWQTFRKEAVESLKEKLHAMQIPPGHPSVDYELRHPQRRTEERQVSAQARASMAALEAEGVTDYEKVPEHHMEPLKDSSAEDEKAITPEVSPELQRKAWVRHNGIKIDPGQVRHMAQVHDELDTSKGPWQQHIKLSKPADPEGSRSLVEALRQLLPARDYIPEKGSPYQAPPADDARVAGLRAAVAALDPATREASIADARKFLDEAVPNGQQQAALFGNLLEAVAKTPAAAEQSIDSPNAETSAAEPSTVSTEQSAAAPATLSPDEEAAFRNRNASLFEERDLHIQTTKRAPRKTKATPPRLQPEHSAALEQAIDAAPVDDGVDESKKPITDNVEEQSAAFAGKVVPEQGDGEHEGQHDQLIDHTREQLQAAGKDPDQTMQTLADANQIHEESAAVDKPAKAGKRSEKETFVPKLWTQYSPDAVARVLSDAGTVVRAKRSPTLKSLNSVYRETLKQEAIRRTEGKPYHVRERAIREARQTADLDYADLSDEHIQEILQMRKHGYNEDAHNRALGRPTEAEVTERVREISERRASEEAAKQSEWETQQAKKAVVKQAEWKQAQEARMAAQAAAERNKQRDVERSALTEYKPNPEVDAKIGKLRAARAEVGTHRPPEGTKMDRVGWAAHEDARDVYDHKNTPHEDWPEWAQGMHDNAVAESDARDTPKMSWDEHLAATGRAPTSKQSAAGASPSETPVPTGASTEEQSAAVDAPPPHHQAVAAVKADPAHEHLAPALTEAAKDYHDPEALKAHVITLAQQGLAHARTPQEQHAIMDTTAQFLHAHGGANPTKAMRTARDLLSTPHADILQSLPLEAQEHAKDQIAGASNRWWTARQAQPETRQPDHSMWQHTEEAKNVSHAKPENRVKSLLNHWLPKLGHKLKQGLVGALAAVGIMGAMGATPSADATPTKATSSISVDLPGEGPKLTSASDEMIHGEASSKAAAVNDPTDDNYHVGPESSYLANEWRLQHPDATTDEFIDADRMEANPETGQTEIHLDPNQIKMTGNPIADKAIKMAQDLEGKTYFGLGLSGGKGAGGKIGYQCSSFSAKAAGLPQMDTSAIYHDAQRKSGNKYYKTVPAENMQPGDMLVYPDYKIDKEHHEGHVAVIVDATPGQVKIADASKSDNGVHIRKLHPSFVFMPKTIVARPLKHMKKSLGWDTLEELDIFEQV